MSSLIMAGSTSLMYSFAQRPDAAVYDEPLYAHHLVVTGEDRPYRDQVMDQTPRAPVQTPPFAVPVAVRRSLCRVVTPWRLPPQLLREMENDGQKVVDELILGPHEKDVVFFKHMGKHFINLDADFLDITKNVRTSHRTTIVLILILLLLRTGVSDSGTTRPPPFL